MGESTRGEVVVVTGGAKNLGRAVALRIGSRGGAVVVHHHSAASAQAAQDTVAEIVRSGGEARAFQADLTRADEVERLFAEAVRSYGAVHGVVHTAARFLSRPLLETSVAEFDDIVSATLRSAFLVLRSAGRVLQDGGAIVQVLTSLLVTSQPGSGVFTGSKAAAEQLGRVLARELRSRRISVCAVAPGPMDTPFLWNGVDEDEVRALRGMQAAGLLTDVDEVAAWIAGLLRTGVIVTGQTYLLNGGLAIR
jgi:NAD(P)-dependent dehydrogenase (short-subunit alcohol dehydrogenase family)